MLEYTCEVLYSSLLRKTTLEDGAKDVACTVKWDNCATLLRAVLHGANPVIHDLHIVNI